jgi:NADPH:quinone reductase-like Zn-dependent oxidoreductase
LLTKRALLSATTLRARSAEEKAAIVTEVAEHVWPLIESGLVQPVVDARIPMSDAAQAHRRVEASDHVGKILLIRTPV